MAQRDYTYDWDWELLNEIPADFNDVFSELWSQSEMFGLDLYPHEIEEEAERVLAIKQDQPYSYMVPARNH